MMYGSPTVPAPVPENAGTAGAGPTAEAPKVRTLIGVAINNNTTITDMAVFNFMEITPDRVREVLIL
jgi:hypothetical protein